jgi:hypothetical protein
MRHRHDDDDILKDGERLRVSMFTMDSADPVAVARESLRVVDGEGGTAGLHRPGFRIADARKRTHYDPKGRLRAYSETETEERHGTERHTSDAVRASDTAYRDYEDQLVNAWKTPVGFGGDPSISFGERGSVRQREGGTAMLDCEENAEDIVRDAARHTEAARSRDHRTAEQMMRDHQTRWPISMTNSTTNLAKHGDDHD